MADIYEGAVAGSQRRAREMMGPPLPQPTSNPSAFGLPTGMGAPPVAAPQRSPGLVDAIKQAEAASKRKLTQEELDPIVNRYKTEKYLPRLVSQKGYTKQRQEVDSAAFDSKAQRLIESYLSQGKSAEGVAESKDDILGALGAAGRQGFVDPTIAFGTGVGSGVVGGSLGLIDYAARGLAAGGGALMGLATGGIEGAKAQAAADWGARTPAGDAAQGVTDFFNGLRDRALSPETLTAREGLNKKLSEGAGASEVLSHIASNPSSIGPMVGESASYLTPAAALRIPKLAGLAGAVGKGAPVLAGGLPAVGSAGVGFEAQIESMPITELLATPENKASYEIALDLGLPKADAEAFTKRAAIARGLPAVLAASTVSSVGLPAAFGKFGIERIVAGTGSKGGGWLQRMLGIGAAEGTEETGAAVIEKMGENVATDAATGSDTPIMQGTGGAAALGGTVGTLIGGAAGGLSSSNKRPLRTPKATTAPTAAPTTQKAVAAAVAAAVPTATSITGVAPVVAPGPGVDPKDYDTVLEGVRKKVTAVVGSKTSRAGKRIAEMDTPEAVMTWASGTASSIAGDMWTTMSAPQRMALTIATAQTVAGKTAAKKEDIEATILAVTTELSNALNPPPPAPAVQQQPMPPELAAAVAGPGAAPPAPVPAPVAAPAPSAPVPATPIAPPVAAPPAAMQPPPVAAPSIAPPAAPAQAAAPVAEAPTPRLPPELTKAAPRYGMKKLAFINDVDRALYMLADGAKRSKADAKYLKWAMEVTGLDEAGVRSEGEKIRKALGPLAARITGDTIPVRKQYGVTQPAPKAKPLRTPTPPKTEAPASATEAGADEDTDVEEIVMETLAPEPDETPLGPKPAIRPAENIAAATSSFVATEKELADALGADTLEATELEELAEAVDLAREGDNSALNEYIRTLKAEGAITGPQAATIRVIASSAKPEVTPTVAEPELPGLTAERGTEAERRQTTTQLKGATPKQAIDWLRRSARNDFERSLADLVQARYEELRALGARFTFLVGNSGRAGSKGTTAYAIIDGLQVQILVDSVEGDYETVLHEFVHGVTSGLLYADPSSKAAQQLLKLHGDIVGRLRNRLNAKRTSRYEQHMITATNILEKPQEILAWGLANQEFQTWLNNEQDSSGKTFLGRLFRAVGDMLGIPAKDDSLFARLLTISDTLLTESLTPYIDVAASRGYSLTGTPKLLPEWAGSVEGMEGLILEDRRESTPENVEETAVTSIQRLGETLINNTEAYRKSEQFVESNGGTVTDETSPTMAVVIRDGHISSHVSVDEAQVIAPVESWLTANWRSFGVSGPEFIKRVSRFFQTKNMLERYNTLYLQQVDIGGKDFARDTIMDGLVDRSITPAGARAQLESLVAQNAMQSFEAWANKRFKRAGSVASMNEELTRLADGGMDESTMAELNSLMDAMRQRAREHLVAAGKFPADDPWVDFYDWKYYVPLKGSPEQDEATALDYDGPEGAAALKALNAQVKTFKGRKSFVENPFEQLFVDTRLAAKAHANGAFTEALYGYVVDNQALLRAEVAIYTGDPKTGYVDEEGNTTKELPMPQGFVHSTGDTHYVVTLPKDSQLLRGIKKQGSDISAWQVYLKTGIPLQILGKLTNIRGRLLTTLNPSWQFFVAFVRDVNYMPAMVAVKAFDSPWKASRFAAHYTQELVKNMGAMPSIFAQLGGGYNKLKEIADADPTSFAAKLIRYRENGGASDITAGYNVEQEAKALEKLLANSTGLRRATDATLGRVVRFTDRLANTLESVARVAANEALITVGKSEREAAATVKGALNYQQSGDFGRVINAAFMFYRIGATGLDAMRVAFIKKDGNWDLPKIAKWMPFFAGAGTILYALLSTMMGDDEEDGVAYMQKMRAETLTQSLIIPTGPNGKHVKIAIGLGLPQLLMAPGILGSAVAHGHMTIEEAGAAYLGTINRNLPQRLVGVKEGSGASGFLASLGLSSVPSVLSPMVESYVNVNAFGSGIRTDFPDENKFASDQGKANTAQEFKDMAAWARENFSTDMYPETIQHLATSYGGSLVRDVIQSTIGQSTRTDIGREDTAIRTTLRVGVNDAEYYYQNEMYDVLDELRPAVQKYESAKKESPEAAVMLESRDKELREQRAAHKQLDTARRAYYKGIAELRIKPFMTTTGKTLQRKRLDSELRKAVEVARRSID